MDVADSKVIAKIHWKFQLSCKRKLPVQFLRINDVSFSFSLLGSLWLYFGNVTNRSFPFVKRLWVILKLLQLLILSSDIGLFLGELDFRQQIFLVVLKSETS